MRKTIKHIKTDPACRHYRTPRSAWAQRRHHRARGITCWLCVPSIAVLLDPAQDEAMTAQDEADQRARDIDAGWCDHGPFEACRCLFDRENPAPFF